MGMLKAFFGGIWSATKVTSSIVWRMILLAVVTLNLALLILFFCLFNALDKGQTDLNVLAISITVLELLLAVTAISGFWLIRGAAITRASETAREVAEELAETAARKWMDDNAAPIIRRTVLEADNMADGESAESDTDLDGFASSLAQKKGGGGVENG